MNRATLRKASKLPPSADSFVDSAPLRPARRRMFRYLAARLDTENSERKIVTHADGFVVSRSNRMHKLECICDGAWRANIVDPGLRLQNRETAAKLAQQP
jgi:hypothetical protein